MVCRGKPKGRTEPVRPFAIMKLLRVHRFDVDGLAAALGAELHRSGDEGEQRVVAAAAHAITGVEVRATLADDDLARVDELTAEALHAEALCV